MTCLHRCEWCDGDYPCETTQEVSEGVYRCACPSPTECPGCSKHGACEECGKAPATGDGHQPFYCAACEATWLDNYSGPDEPDYDRVTLDEQYQAAAAIKRSQR